jgi:single-strand DNA-binding protein
MKNISIAGTTGKDAVMRRTQSGEPVLGWSVAVDDGYGENKTTLWFDCSLWGKRGDSLVQYLKKGTKVAVSGELSTRIHEGKTYLMVSVQNVTLMGSKPAEKQAEDKGGSQPNFSEDLDDRIPFGAEFR